MCFLWLFGDVRFSSWQANDVNDFFLKKKKNALETNRFALLGRLT